MNNVQLLEMSKKQLLNKRGSWQVILHNDNHNTFDHVVNCLMDICQHNYIQSSQCAHIVHTAQKCNIFIDSYEECLLVRDELHEQGLSVTLIKYKKND
jgi:ATP-dependent Clp protease adaptor protein ClpS